MAEYLMERLLPEAFASALSRPGAIKETATNLYIVNRAASVAREENLSSPDKEDWQCRSARDRFALDLLVERETELRLESMDWDALAKEQYLLEFDVGKAVREVSVSHILVSSETRSFDDMVERVEEIRSALSDGRDFNLVAKDYSDDESASLNSGRLGFVERGKTHPAFEKAAYGLERIGSVSEPVVTSFGIHIIRLNDVRQKEPLPFESVKGLLVDRLKKQQALPLRKTALEPFRQEVQPYVVDINEAELAARLLKRMLAD